MRSIYLTLILALACTAARAESDANTQLPDAPVPAVHADSPTLRSIPRDLLQEERAIWTSPLHASDRTMLEGMAFIAVAGVIGSEDRSFMQKHFTDANTNRHANTASTGLTGLLGAAPFAYYGVGHLRNNVEAQQTGILAGEAIANSLALNEVLKITTRRERPNVDNAEGRFFQPGVGWNSSFASSHSAIAWSSATVIAERSHSRWVKLAAYGIATGVSASRIAGRDHFPSDVFVGSSLGWAVGHAVARRHHQHPAPLVQ